MNNSQLLYKISGLQYSIRRKELEYSNSVKAGDQVNIDSAKAALMLLKEDLADTVKEFNSIPPHTSAYKDKRTQWWQRLFNLRIGLNRKQ